MADMTTTPLQNQFETQVQGEISSGSTVPFDITVRKAIDFTPESSGFRIIVEPGTSKEEGMIVTAVSGTTWTIGTRGVPIAKGGDSTVTTHGGGATIIITDTWSTFDDLTTAINSKPSLDDSNTWTGSQTFSDAVDFTGAVDCEDDLTFSGTDKSGLTLKNLTTAQRTAITPDDGAMVYDTDDDLVYQGLGGAWASVDTGTAYTGGEGIDITGTEISVDTSDTDTFVKTSSGASDEDKAVILNSSGQIASGFLNSSSFLTSSDVNMKAGNGSWSPTAVSQTKVIAHGLGRTPKMLTLEWKAPVFVSGLTAFDDFAEGTTYYDGTTQNYIVRKHSTAGTISMVVSSGKAIDIAYGGSTFWEATVAMNSTNITFTVSSFTASTNVGFIWKVE